MPQTSGAEQRCGGAGERISSRPWGWNTDNAEQREADQAHDSNAL